MPSLDLEPQAPGALPPEPGMAGQAVAPSRRLPGGQLARFLPIVALIVFVLVFGRVEGDSRKWIDIGTEAMYLAVAAVGVNILLGYTGLLSLGHAAFFVAGGDAGAIPSPALGIPPGGGVLLALFGSPRPAALLCAM